MGNSWRYEGDLCSSGGTNMGNVFGRLLQRTFPTLRQYETQISKLQENNKTLMEERERQRTLIDNLVKEQEQEQQKIKVLEEEKEKQGQLINVLENENIKLGLVITKVKDQFSQLSTKYRLLIVGGRFFALVLYLRWRRERDARNLAEYRMVLLELPDNLTCVVCLENPRQEVLVPCGHICLCSSCVDSVGMEEGGLPFRCPVCRSWVQETKRVFLA